MLMSSAYDICSGPVRDIRRYDELARMRILEVASKDAVSCIVHVRSHHVRFDVLIRSIRIYDEHDEVVPHSKTGLPSSKLVRQTECGIATGGRPCSLYGQQTPAPAFSPEN